MTFLMYERRAELSSDFEVGNSRKEHLDILLANDDQDQLMFSPKRPVDSQFIIE